MRRISNDTRTIPSWPCSASAITSWPRQMRPRVRTSSQHLQRIRGHVCQMRALSHEKATAEYGKRCWLARALSTWRAVRDIFLKAAAGGHAFE